VARVGDHSDTLAAGPIVGVALTILKRDASDFGSAAESALA
jgi:hypothetical protein